MGNFELLPFSKPSIDQYRALITDPRVAKHMPLAQPSYSDDWISEWVLNKSATWGNPSFGPWSVWRENEFLGWAGFEPDSEGLSVGIVLHPKHWGFGEEVLRLISIRATNLFPDKMLILELPDSRRPEYFGRRFGLKKLGVATINGISFHRYQLDPSRL
jgi:hypothetical protein